MRDEIIAVHKKRLLDDKIIDPNEDLTQDKSSLAIDIETVIVVVNKATDSIMARLKGLTYFDQNEPNKMNTLVQLAKNPDNLCRMDPTYFPAL